jgi:hypothetical protein
MSLYRVKVELWIDVGLKRNEFKDFLQNASMNDILDRTIDMSLSRKDVERIIKTRETKE